MEPKNIYHNLMHLTTVRRLRGSCSHVSLSVLLPEREKKSCASLYLLPCRTKCCCCWLLNEVGIECFIRVAFVPWPTGNVRSKLSGIACFEAFCSKTCFAKCNLLVALYEANVKRVAFVPWPSGNVHATFHVKRKLRSWFEAFCSKRTNPANFRNQC